MSFYRCDELEKTGLVYAAFTDKNEPCRRNNSEDIKRIGEIFGVSEEKITVSRQKHTDIVYAVTEENCGLGCVKDYAEDEYADGLVTDMRGVMLATYEADCVPVYLLDPVRRAVGMVHSGWKGTAKKICRAAVGKMTDKFGSLPSDIIAYFGPCICGKCYEVGGELKEEFAVNFTSSEIESFFKEKGDGKFLLDMKKAINYTLKEAGIDVKNIFDSSVCTYESESICSYRRDGEKEHRLASFIVLR